MYSKWLKEAFLNEEMTYKRFIFLLTLSRMAHILVKWFRHIATIWVLNSKGEWISLSFSSIMRYFISQNYNLVNYIKKISKLIWSVIIENYFIIQKVNGDLEGLMKSLNIIGILFETNVFIFHIMLWDMALFPYTDAGTPYINFSEHLQLHIEVE